MSLWTYIFTDFFNVDPVKLEEYGAFNISLINDLPLFVIIFVNKDRKVEFFRYGDFTEKDKADFWKVVNKYK